MVSPSRQRCRHLPPSPAAHPREAAAEQWRAPPAAPETALGGGRAAAAAAGAGARCVGPDAGGRAAGAGARAGARGARGESPALGAARRSSAPLPPSAARPPSPRRSPSLGAPERCSEATARGEQVPDTCPRPEPVCPRRSRLAASPRPLPSLVPSGSGE